MIENRHSTDVDAADTAGAPADQDADHEMLGAYGWQFFLGACAICLGSMSGVAAWLALRGLTHHWAGFIGVAIGISSTGLLLTSVAVVGLLAEIRDRL